MVIIYSIMRNILRPPAFLIGALAASLLPFPGAAQQTGSVLIWPVNPVIETDKRAAALWLENPGKTPVSLQVRIYAWDQVGGKNVYASQEEVVGTPPIVTIAPGAKQLVRLTRMGPVPGKPETPYRIIVDEIPAPATAGSAAGAAISFRMRYSIPLFVIGTGDGRSADLPRPKLAWRIVKDAGTNFVEIRNDGSVRARLTEAFIDGRTPLGNGLLGYVLPRRVMRWPLPPGVTGDALSASVNGIPVVPLERTSD